MEVERAQASNGVRRKTTQTQGSEKESKEESGVEQRYYTPSLRVESMGHSKTFVCMVITLPELMLRLGVMSDLVRFREGVD